jgi:SWI/SNF-related matrix-associated actin-dependent regulator 1 of chromatin subfamily A
MVEVALCCVDFLLTANFSAVKNIPFMSMAAARGAHPSAVDKLLFSRSLRPYQRAGSVWATSKLHEADTRAAAILDEPGLGKTATALLTAVNLDVRRMLVVSPAGARRVWSQEIERWVPQWSRHVLIIEPGMPLLRDRFALLDRPELIVLISYDALSDRSGSRPAWTKALAERRWDLLILDEAHYLKNRSNRTLAVYGARGSGEGIQAACERVLLLTGTITPNHAGELFQHLRTLWPTTLLVPRAPLRSYPSGVVPRGKRTAVPTIGPAQPPLRSLTEAEFQERVTDYRDTIYGRQIVRSKNQAWLRERVGPYVLRRTKAMVLPELPPLVTQDIPLPVSAVTIRKVDPVIWRRGVTLMEHTRAADDDAFVRALRTHDDEGPGAVTTLRRELGVLKADPAADWIIERLACGMQKILVFGWHIEVLRRLHERLAEFNPVIITGATSASARSDDAFLFQNHPLVRVLIGQILAAGTAITLTAASEVVMVEPSWVPGENRQAIDRAHRLGQQDSVLATFLYIPGTLDQRIMSVFRRKAVEVDPIILPEGNIHAHARCSSAT